MTCKEQNKILNVKIESNINQYKVDRLNAEISAFSSGDLNKYEFLTRKDLKYKPSALDKARFQFSPLGQTFSIGLDKTAQGYQKEGVMKLLKDIRDVLICGVRLPGPDDNNDNDDDNDDDDDDNDGNNNVDNNVDNNDKFSEYQEVISSLLEEINNKKYTNDNDDDTNDDDTNDNDDDNDDNVALNSVFLNNLNNEISNIKSDGKYYARLIAYQNATIEKLEKELTDRKNLTKDIIDEASKIMKENKKEHLEYYNKYKNTLFDYIKTLKQLNNAENTYGGEIRNLNNTINDEAIRTNGLRNRIEYLEDVEEESLEIIDDINIKLDELKNKFFFLKDDNKKLRKSINLIKNNNEYLIKENNEIQDKVKKDEAKIHDMLNKFNDNMKKNSSNLYKEFKHKKKKLVLN